MVLTYQSGCLLQLCSTFVGTKESPAVAICDACVTGVGVPNLSCNLSRVAGWLEKTRQNGWRKPAKIVKHDVVVKFIQLLVTADFLQQHIWMVVGFILQFQCSHRYLSQRWRMVRYPRTFGYVLKWNDTAQNSTSHEGCRKQQNSETCNELSPDF